uniref:Uncharacterized protein n=1 Tax=Peronospora matthiolae TaxID=2874970 RepID=A0AAV1UBD0_9STRA
MNEGDDGQADSRMPSLDEVTTSTQHKCLLIETTSNRKQMSHQVSMFASSRLECGALGTRGRFPSVNSSERLPKDRVGTGA